jgi:hypothetical protein
MGAPFFLARRVGLSPLVAGPSKEKNRITINKAISTNMYRRLCLDILQSIFSLKKALFQFKNQFPAQKNETKSHKSNSIWSSIDSLIL